MLGTYADRHLGPRRPIVADTSVPPRVDTSVVMFVSMFLLANLAIVALITLVAMAPLTVTIPLGVVLLAYVVGTVIVSAGVRSRQRPSGVGAVAVVSLVLLASASWVPERIGAAFAVLGVAGLFVYRLIAMPVGWASRGLAKRDTTVDD